MNNSTDKIGTANKPSAKSFTLWLFTLFCVVALIIWGCLWYFSFRFYESTDDAYANGHLVTINSLISGSIISYYVENTDFVEKGQLLVQLDPINYAIKYEETLANLAEAVLQVRQLYNKVELAKVTVENRKEELKKIEYDFNNREKLVASKAISNEDFIHAQNNLLVAGLALQEAILQQQIAADAAGNTPLELHPLIEKNKALIKQAYYNLAHTSVYAPISGIIAQCNVDVGKSVSTSTPLLAIVPVSPVWVDANFKETQLTSLRIGQPATVWFDLYGSAVEYEGKVAGIPAGTGSIFSLIPPQNATGNWIKIVQRLPVRIAVESANLKKYPFRLGISAHVEVDISNTNLPFVNSKTVKEAAESTDIYQISYEKVDEQIAQIIRDNS